MNGDPFERFERSRGGLLIPVLIFIVGAVLTTLALRGLDGLVSLKGLADEPPAAAVPAIENNIAGAIEPANENEVENENQEPSPQ